MSISDEISTQPKNGFDLICFSHLRWDFVYQRPQHLLSRFARERRVFVIEEPIFGGAESRFEISRREDNLYLVVPHIPHDLAGKSLEQAQTELLDELIGEQKIENYAVWYYTPMMLAWSAHLRPSLTIYDCMDELSAFKNAPPELLTREAELFSRADLVFTGGHSLYEAKRDRHPAVFAFPSSIDKEHFGKALTISDEPSDQKDIPSPRIGFFGVIDERTDIELLRAIAGLKPEWQFVMIGPVVKIDDADLPKSENIHYLGGKNYQELPAYIAGWQVAMMPFEMNDSTKFISPTKTPEYLAAGKPVVSTPIRDVVKPYGEEGLAYIAATPDAFVAAIEKALNDDENERRQKVTKFLADVSWDKTFQAMSDLISEKLAARQVKAAGEVS